MTSPDRRKGAVSTLVSHSAAVMEACLHEDDALVLDAVDHAVLLGEAAGPYIWTQVLDRLGFADAPGRGHGGYCQLTA